MNVAIRDARYAIRSSSRYHWYAMAAIMLGTMMSTLDISIVYVAISTIARAYARPLSDTEWVILAFMLVSASTLVLFGRLGDMFGQKRIFLSGFAVFGLSSLACAFAPTLEVLIAARVVQAVGAAMLLSSNQALIVDTFPASERGRAIGFNGAAVFIGLSLGPIIGGAIVTFGDWRWIFMINVPISIIALIGGALILKPTKGKSSGFDPAGALLSIAGLFALSLALSRADVWGWSSGRTLGLLALAVMLIAAFIFLERRVTSPTLDLTLFNSRLFAFSVLGAVIYFVVFSGLIFVVPLVAQTVLGETGFDAGLLLTPLTVMSVAIAPIAGSLSDRVPVRYVATTGALVVGFGLLLLSRLPHYPPRWELMFFLAVTGVGTAIFSQPNNSAIMGSAPENRRGIAAGTLATARATGQLLGVAVAGAIYFPLAERMGALGKTFAPATAYFEVAAVLMVICALVSWTRDE